MIQTRKQNSLKLHIAPPSEALAASRMIIPFSDNYHVPDLIDWCSFSCPLLVAPRTANRRRTEKIMCTIRG
jgi:hypothetical protein